MLAIEILFPSGRYHATAWGHHVNEGVVEWPPSPWRLLRALVATWHLKAGDEISGEQMVRLVESLGHHLPRYRLPPGTASHTRHYMPLYKDKPTKVLDTFIHVSNDMSLQVAWPDLVLSQEDGSALGLLLDRIGYLGRAESWVEARLLRRDEQPAEPNVEPVPDGREPGEGEDMVRVLSPVPATQLAAWRAQTFERELQRIEQVKRQTALQKGKRADTIKVTRADMEKVDATLPKTMLDALHADTSDLYSQGWSSVPGARWVDYGRPRHLLTVTPVGRPRTRTSTLPTAARFAVASQVPPRLTDVVSLADRVRRSLMSRSNAHSVFSGKQPDGTPMRGHGHAFVLPEANGAHGRVTHVTVYARMGFDSEARRALESLRNVWGRDRHEVQLVLLGVGQPEDFAGPNTAAGQCPLFCASEEWLSRTPFVSTRNPKTTRSGMAKVDAVGLQIGSPEHDLRRLLREAGLPEPVQVAPTPSTSLGGKEARWLEFYTARPSGAGRRARTSGVGFRLVFARAVRGPIAVGYGAHFGLGVFSPDRQ